MFYHNSCNLDGVVETSYNPKLFMEFTVDLSFRNPQGMPLRSLVNRLACELIDAKVGIESAQSVKEKQAIFRSKVTSLLSNSRKMFVASQYPSVPGLEFSPLTSKFINCTEDAPVNFEALVQRVKAAQKKLRKTKAATISPPIAKKMCSQKDVVNVLSNKCIVMSLVLSAMKIVRGLKRKYEGKKFTPTVKEIKSMKQIWGSARHLRDDVKEFSVESLKAGNIERASKYRELMDRIEDMADWLDSYAVGFAFLDKEER